MKILVIQSGSKGNATLVIDEGRVLLIDMGISLSCLKEALESENKKLLDIDALLLTHDHSDHTKGICYLDPLPIYCGEGTYEGFNVNLVDYFESFNIGHLKITVLRTSHDAVKPMGFMIESKNEKLVYITDTGMIPDKTMRIIGNADYYVIESNHNVKMLMDTNRPQMLKCRILSEHGHLNNEDSAMYMCEAVGSNTKEIILAHLSEEANDPEVALKTYKKIFKREGVSLKNINLHCANQHVLTIGGKE